MLDPTAPTWEAKFKVLAEQTEHHHQEEEENLFPKVNKAMAPRELDALGTQLLACQEQVAQGGDSREAVMEQTEEAAPLK